MESTVGKAVGLAIGVGFGLAALNTINKFNQNLNQPRSYIRKDYCPRCKKRTEHIKDKSEKMCIVCGYKERLNNWTLI